MLGTRLCVQLCLGLMQTSCMKSVHAHEHPHHLHHQQARLLENIVPIQPHSTPSAAAAAVSPFSGHVIAKCLPLSLQTCTPHIHKPTIAPSICAFALSTISLQAFCIQKASSMTRGTATRRQRLQSVARLGSNIGICSRTLSQLSLHMPTILIVPVTRQSSSSAHVHSTASRRKAVGRVDRADDLDWRVTGRQ